MTAGGALFDGHVAVDWSAAGRPRKGTDSIWIARAGIAPENPPTRTAAMARLAALLDAATARGERWLVSFDFAFGYPRGLADALAPGASWADVWARIADLVEDGPDNANTRFDAAAALNALFPAPGPFWGNGLSRDIPGLPRVKPGGWGDVLPQNTRDADRRAPGAQEVWKLSGAGSVGGQTLTGIAALERFRRHRRGHGGDVAIWPFETLGEGRAHVLAEGFPSLLPLPPGPEPRDARQVATLAAALRAADASGLLAEMLRAPQDDPPDVRTHEATILGLSHRDALAGAPESGPTSADPAAGPPKVSAPPVRKMRPYLKDPQAIYAESFATVRREARLERFGPGLETMAIRLIHACGMIDVADRLAFSPAAFEAGRAALAAGAPVLCDAEMVASGVIRRLLPPGVEVVTTLNDAGVPERAQAIGNTRSAAAVELWRSRIEGAVVAIGNAPTALFHLLELLDAGWPRPALILGFPVGFVGAAESKAELAARPRGCDFVTLRGRRGGSAMAAAAVNALTVGTGTRVH